MIIEILVIVLTPLAIYNILKSFNVPATPAIVISAIYTLLLLVAFEWIMLAVAIIAITIIAVIVYYAIKDRNKVKNTARKTLVMK